MNTSKDFLIAVKAKTGATSDYALAKLLDTSTTVISNYMTKNRPMSDDIGLKVASILEIDQGIVLAALQVERSKNETEKKAWTALFERLGGVAASVMIATTIFSNSAPVEASERVTSRNDVYYVNTIT
jgi:predicted transcriptional regulator